MSAPDELRSRAASLMPELLDDLERLVAIPSEAFPGCPPEPVNQMASAALRLFRQAGLANAELQQVPAGYPPVYGELLGPGGAPTVMLYAHYDVQPAPPEQGWTSDPWTATRKPDGRIYGRGAADDKGGLVVHLGTLKVFDGKPPCTVKLILEGMEETDSNLEAFVQANPDLSAEEFRSISDLLAGVGLSGSGPVGERLWSRPSVSAIGIDTTSVAGASNVLIPEARAKLSMRIVPGSDPERELDALVRHLASHAPWGAQVEVERVDAVPGFRCATDGPAYAAARPRGSTPRTRAWTPPRSSG